MLLRDSKHSGRATFHSVVEKARRFRGDDREGYRGEFIQLVELASSIGSRCPGDTCVAPVGVSR
jgi:Ca-activated chloride channel family protein